MYMPVPAMSHAMTAPIGPVAVAKVRGREKIPAPTIPPTTIVVNAKRESFCVVPDAIDHSSVPACRRAAVKIRFIKSASRA
jgi:hypothetical protein